MIKDIDDLILVQKVADAIAIGGADEFLKDLTQYYPIIAQQLANAILADHARDYDKKKAALLKAHAS